MRIAIIGGGILGTSLAYALTRERSIGVTVFERSEQVGLHASSRNTGVVHRPFYLHPEKKAAFARYANYSFRFWKDYAERRGLPWRLTGTLEVAVAVEDLAALVRYRDWAVVNGMERDEIALLSAADVRDLEPHVKCLGALLCFTDASVDFGAFTRALRRDAEANGARFITGIELIDSHDAAADFVLNCAGGGALRLAQAEGIGREYADLFVRGEYWVVNSERATLATHNVYAVPRRSEFPFLDPHWVVRHDGSAVIGPNAVPVGGPFCYDGRGGFVRALFHRPLRPRWKLFWNREFRTLSHEERASSRSKDAFVARVRRFLPDLTADDLVAPGPAGVRSLIIDRTGRILDEPLELWGEHSLHILNYNSPGATGAPAYAAELVRKLIEREIFPAALK